MEASAKAFIAQLQFPAEGGNDEAALVKFALTMGAKTPFTSVEHDLQAALDAPYPGDTNGTVLYDATLEAIAQYAGRLAGSQQVVIVFSDGNDEESLSTLTEVISSALNHGIPLFTIAYTSASTSKPQIMQQLAQETGGRFFAAPTVTQLASIYQTISTILSHQYLIAYSTSSSSGGTVLVDVEVNEVGNLGEGSKEIAGCP
jgi:VWFA-related protein